MTKIIDWHTHWLSPRALAYLETRSSAPRVQRRPDGGLEFLVNSSVLARAIPIGPTFFDGPTRIAHIDEAGIDHQVISWPTTLGVDPALDAAASRTLFRDYNDDLAELVARHPGRLSGLAALTTADIEWSAQELDRAHRELGLIGAVLPAGAFLSLDGARHVAPILEVAQRHGSHLYLHTGLAHPSVPGQWAHPPAADAATARWLLESTSQFSAAWITLTLTDFLTPFPDVTVQLAMLGGILPALAGSIDARGRKEGLPPQLPALRRIYIDTGVLGSDPEALGLAVRVLGPERILFGSDYPLVPSSPVLAAVRGSGLEAATLQTLFNNGREIIERLARAA